MRKGIKIIAILVFIAIAIVLLLRTSKGVGIKTTTVQRQPFLITVTATSTGTIKAETEARISSQRTGRITKLLFDEGTFVDDKKVIAELDSEEEYLNLRLAEATLQKAKAILSETEKRLKRALNIMTAVLAGIATISLIVGGIGIMNIMLVSVKERTREIGIRKAVGAKNRDVLLQFLAESVILSVIGGIGGIILGIALSVGLHYFFDFLPTHITWWSIVVAFLFSGIIGIFFGVYPARKASLYDPIVALRYE